LQEGLQGLKPAVITCNVCLYDAIVVAIDWRDRWRDRSPRSVAKPIAAISHCVNILQLVYM